MASASQAVNVIERDAILERTTAVLAQAVAGEVGVHLQRASPTLAGIYVRGLTGNKVNVFFDGVRYSNAAQRGGINTFLGLVDPASLERVGEPRVLVQQVSNDTRTGSVAASVVEGGALAYRLGRDPQREFVWMDRSGRRLGRLGEPGPWHNFDLSPDGTRVIAATRWRGCPAAGREPTAGCWSGVI